MNPWLLKIADGTAFLAATAVIAVGVMVLPLKQFPRPIRFFSGVIVVVAFGIAFLSATPMPGLLYAVWLAVVLASVLCGSLGRRAAKGSSASLFLSIVAALVTVVVGASELLHRRAPTIRVSAGQPIYVVGDSISAGIGSNESPWPVLLSELSGIQVINLARAGATVESAQKQVAGLTNRPAVVIVEIGGNDLIANTDVATFYRQLDALLTNLKAGGNTLAMMELPLLPFRQEFGRAQRLLAQKHHVILIPKRYLARVLGLPNGTTDGLHLSPSGHRALAESIFSLLKRSGG